MSRQRNLSILNMDVNGLFGWPTHQSKETNYRKVDSGWVKITLDKITKDD
jgi:hypothetical protein